MSNDAPEPEIDPELVQHGLTPEEIEREEAEARENFTLKDLFGGPPRPGMLPEKKVLIYTDLDAVGAYADLEAVIARKRRMLDAASDPEKPKRGASAEEKAAYIAAKAEYDEARSELEAEVESESVTLEEVKEKMLSTALSFHMRAYPQIAQKVARREARNLFLDPQTKDIRDGYSWEDANEWMELRLFGETVLSVHRSDGQEIKFGVPKSELGEFLSSGNMHPSIWEALRGAYEELTIRSGIRRVAVEDPGF